MRPGIACHCVLGVAAIGASASGSTQTESFCVQTVEWGLNMMEGGGHKLREAERSAKQAKAGGLISPQCPEL